MDPLYMIIAASIAFLVGGGITWYCLRCRAVANQEVSNANNCNNCTSMEEGGFAAIDHLLLNDHEVTPAEPEPAAGVQTYTSDLVPSAG